jgi:uncharacterized protein
MNQTAIISHIVSHLKKEFSEDSSGHDWFHIERVWKLAKQIAKKENANLFIVEVSALLHDIADHKFVKNDKIEAEKRILSLLSSFNIATEDLESIIFIVQNCSFKGGIDENKITTLEGKIVQDADKLDAIGAIGIARTFAFGGKFGSILYDPEIPPINHKSVASYQNNRTHTINHFYEKLLLLKNLMHTQTAKKIAEQRHQFMLTFLNQFYDEWEAKL